LQCRSFASRSIIRVVSNISSERVGLEVSPVGVAGTGAEVPPLAGGGVPSDAVGTEDTGGPVLADDDGGNVPITTTSVGDVVVWLVLPPPIVGEDVNPGGAVAGATVVAVLVPELVLVGAPVPPDIGLVVVALPLAESVGAAVPPKIGLVVVALPLAEGVGTEVPPKIGLVVVALPLAESVGAAVPPTIGLVVVALPLAESVGTAVPPTTGLIVVALPLAEGVGIEVSPTIGVVVGAFVIALLALVGMYVGFDPFGADDSGKYGDKVPAPSPPEGDFVGMSSSSVVGDNVGETSTRLVQYKLSNTAETLSTPPSAGFFK
jgi:hypothetical protein